jgi:hypothetical protein
VKVFSGEKMTHCILNLVFFATLTFGQTFEVKDRNGVPVATVDNVTMFQHSDYFKEDIPHFQGTVKNTSGERLLGVSIAGIVHKKDGTVVKFGLGSICGGAALCDLPKGFTHEAMYLFSQPWPLKPADFDSLEFTLERAKRLITEDGFHFSGIISKDQGCFSDYLATKTLTGVLLRKKLLELVEYGCGFVVEAPQEALVLEYSKAAFGVGTKRVAAVEVDLLGLVDVLMGNKPPSFPFSTGWVPRSTLVPSPVLRAAEIGVSK